MPKRIQLSRKKGWRKPEGCIVVSRQSSWGNPFKIGGWYRRVGASYCICTDYNVRWRETEGTEIKNAQMAKDWFQWFIGQPSMITDRNEIRRELGGHDLACWCRLDQPCHADVLLEIANSPMEPEDKP